MSSNSMQALEQVKTISLENKRATRLRSVAQQVKELNRIHGQHPSLSRQGIIDSNGSPNDVKSESTLVDGTSTDPLIPASNTQNATVASSEYPAINANDTTFSITPMFGSSIRRHESQNQKLPPRDGSSDDVKTDPCEYKLSLWSKVKGRMSKNPGLTPIRTQQLRIPSGKKEALSILTPESDGPSRSASDRFDLKFRSSSNPIIEHVTHEQSKSFPFFHHTEPKTSRTCTTSLSAFPSREIYSVNPSSLSSSSLYNKSETALTQSEPHNEDPWSCLKIHSVPDLRNGFSQSPRVSIKSSHDILLLSTTLAATQLSIPATANADSTAPIKDNQDNSKMPLSPAYSIHDETNSEEIDPCESALIEFDIIQTYSSLSI